MTLPTCIGINFSEVVLVPHSHHLNAMLIGICTKAGSISFHRMSKLQGCLDMARHHEIACGKQALSPKHQAQAPGLLLQSWEPAEHLLAWHCFKQP